MALSLALHGLAAMPLLLAGPSGGTPVEEPAIVVEMALAAPAPADTTGAADIPVPDPARPVDASDIPPPPRAVETPVELPSPDQPPPVDWRELAEKKIELPEPEDPPPLTAADLKPAAPPKPTPPVLPRPAQARPKPPASPAPAHAAQKPAVAQAESASNAGTAQITQGAAAQPPSPVWADKANFRVRPQPVYPPRAVELGQQGEAVFHVRLERDGSIAEIVLKRSSGHELLDRAAIAAVRIAQFQPEMRNGQPVAAWVQFPVRFHLR